MAWPTWLVPPPPSPASANRGPDTASPSPGALPALPGAGDALASPSGSLTVVKPRATRPIAPLHDLKPGGGEPWLVGRWLKWSQDKLNALDKSTAEALPAVERDVKRRVGRVALAITQEYIHQFPPLEVYLADRAFEMDEMRNAAARARLAERAAKAMSDADEDQTEDAREKDEDEPASPEPTEPKPTEAEAKTETESRAAETTPSTASKPPSASKRARRKLTDFFFAGGHDAAVEAATDAREETKSETTKTRSPAPTQTPTRSSPPAERADPARSVSAETPSTSSVEETRAGRRETDREREARWAREGAALAASLAAPRWTRRAASSAASRARRSKPADENAPQPSTNRPRVSRGSAAAAMAPVAAGSSTAAAALAPPPRTTLDAPSAETMERPTRVAETPAPIPSSGPRARSSSVRVTVDGVDVAERRMEREARRAARAAAREERTARARVEGDATVEGTPSKRRGLRDVSNVGAVGGAVAGAKGPYVDMLSRLRAAAQSTAKAWNDLAMEKFDGGGEFRAASGSAGGDKVRLESVVTMSVDGADVLVQTREVSVAGKQS